MKFKLSIMKKLILITILTPIISFSQTYYDSALNFQNSIRSYYDLTPLSYDNDLSLIAQEWANHIAITGEFELSDDSLGETIYAISKTAPKIPDNLLLDASVSWAVDSDEHAFNQIICVDCSNLGFGVAENLEYIYVVAKYDKIYK